MIFPHLFFAFLKYPVMHKSKTTMITIPYQMIHVLPIFTLLSKFQGVLMCEKDVCLTWEVMNNNLMLTCTVPDLLYRISIDDPSGITIAQCIPALTCLTSEVKGLDSPQLRSKLAVTLPINDNDTNKWTGLWTCRHGSSGKFAAIAVPMNVNEQTVESTPAKTQTSAFQGNLFTTRNSNANSVEQEDHLFGTLFASLAALVALLFVIFALCNIWISRKCLYKKRQLWRPNNTHFEKQSPVLSNTNLQPEYESNNAGYECINEANMIPNFPETHTHHIEVCMHHIPILDDNLQTSTSNSSKSDNSYLEVIGDSNSTCSYEKVISRNDNINSNRYCEFKHTDSCHIGNWQRSNTCKNITTDQRRIKANLTESKLHAFSLQMTTYSSDSAKHETFPVSKSCPELNLASHGNAISKSNPNACFAGSTVRNNMMSTVL